MAENGMIMGGVFYAAVKDDYNDCPESCDLIIKCNENNTAPCLLFGEKHHFEKRSTNIKTK